MSEPTSARPRPRGQLLLAVLALLLVHALLGGLTIERMGRAFDEPAHLVGGYAALSTGDYRLCDTSWLPGRWAALPLLLLDDVPPVTDSGAWQRAEVFHVAFDVLGTELSSARERLLLGRRMMLLLSLAGGLLVFVIARRLHGPRGGLISLGLYALSPAIRAHATLVTADLAAALALLAGTWTTWLLLHRVTWPRLLAGCAAVSLALLVKASTLALLPVAALLACWRLVRAEPWPVRLDGRERSVASWRRLGVLGGVTLAHALVGWCVVWAFWGFRAEASEAPEMRAPLELRWERALEHSGATGEALQVARDSGLLPEAWLQAIAHVSEHARRPAFLDGEFSDEGFASFMPRMFLRKTTLACFGLLALALISMRPREALPFAVLIGVYFAAAVMAKLSIGHRHLLPLYPALFVLAGGAASWLNDSRRSRWWPALGLLILLVVESLVAGPRALSHFNALGRGESQAWRLVVDSSLDWGQDLSGLAHWLEVRRELDVYLSYFGTDDPLSHGIEATELHSYHPWTYRHGRARGFQLGPGLYVLSATMYQGLHAEPQPFWTEDAEATYRRLRERVDAVFDPATPPETVAALTGDAGWREDYLRLHQLRFVRLREWLHLNRPDPDAQPTPCFLAWRLTVEDIDAALRAAPPYRGSHE